LEFSKELGYVPSVTSSLMK